MKIGELLLPVAVLTPECITPKIQKVYDGFDVEHFTAAMKIKLFFVGEFTFGLLTFSLWAILYGNHFHALHLFLYIFPLLLNMLIYGFVVISNTTNKKIGSCQLIPHIILFGICSSFMFIFELSQLQSWKGVLFYYIIILFYTAWTLAMYRLDYRKFPEILNSEYKAKTSKVWMFIFIFHFLGIWIARNTPRGIIGIGILLLMGFLCHFLSKLLIIASYQPQVVAIVKEKGL